MEGANQLAFSGEPWATISAAKRYTEGCYNSRGWGPIDEDRFDFTSCFESLLYALPIAILAIFGGWELAKLTRKADRGPKGRGKRSKQLYDGKLALASINLAVQLALLAGRILASPHPIDDVAVWSNVAIAAAFAVAIPLHHYAHKRSQRSSTPLLTFYLLFILIDAIRLRTQVVNAAFDKRLVSFVLFCIRFAGILLVFVLECLGPESSTYGRVRLPEGDADDEVVEDDERADCPADYANIFSQLTFGWITPMMITGYKKSLTEDDLWALPREDQADAIGHRMQAKWDAQLKKAAASGGKKKPSLAWAVAQAFGAPYLLATILKFVQDILQFLQPQLLRRLLDFVETYNSNRPEPAYHGYIIAAGMFVCSLAQTAFLHQYFKHVFETGQRVRGGLIAVVYSKSLVLSNEERGGRATGDIVNLMSTDVTRLQDVSAYGLIAISGIFQIVLAFVSLYGLLGWPMFAGVAVMILSIPANTFLARYSTKLQRAQMKNKDQRTRMMNEILNNIRSCAAFECFFPTLANGNARPSQHQALCLGERICEEAIRYPKRQGAGSAAKDGLRLERVDRLVVLVRSTSHFLLTLVLTICPQHAVPCRILVFCDLCRHQPDSPHSGHRLPRDFLVPTSSVSLECLAYGHVSARVCLCSTTQRMLTKSRSNQWVEAYVSIGRLWDFLTGKELQRDATIREDLVQALRPGEDLLTIENGDFVWSTSGEQGSTLSGINLRVKKGELVAVVGRVGCGKSSLLSATLGEMTRLKGSVRVRGKVAYAAQNPWLLSATVRENIVFGHRWDQSFYDQVLDACALRDDIATLKDGDQTEVGEKGISLSGGQKARIAIARAVYARADIYCLDDPLSAVDAHVARHLFDKVIGPEGLLKSKARLLCTNAIPFCQQADEVVLVRQGRITERGGYQDVMASGGELKTLLEEFGKKSAEEEEDNSDGSSETAVATGGESGDDLRKNGANGSADADTKRKLSFAAMRRASMVSPAEAKREALRAAKTSTKPKEEREVGSVKSDVYMQYIKANGYIGSAFYIITILLQQVVSIFTNVWLKNWAQHNSEDGNSDVGYYLGIYLAFGAGTSFLIFINGMALYAFCVVRSAKLMHDGMYNAVMRSPMSFFELTPIGTILNRFSRDIYVIDEVLARVTGGFFRTMAGVAGVVVVITASVPPFLGVIIPLLLVYKGLQSVYLAASRELKRLDATTKSPIFSHFSQTLGGVSTIRAFGQQQRFRLQQEGNVDRNQEAYWASISANRWLAVRLEIIGAIVILAAALLAVGSVSGNKGTDAGLVGLLMSYALSTTQSLNWVVRSATEGESEPLRALLGSLTCFHRSRDEPRQCRACLQLDEAALRGPSRSAGPQTASDLALEGRNRLPALRDSLPGWTRPRPARCQL